MEEILSVENIKKEYGRKGSKHEALRGITFKVYKGEFVGIMGSSGAGKSTLLNIISTIDLPSSGDIYTNGKNTIKMKQNELADFRRDNLGFVFQDSNLLDTLTIKENIMLPLSLKNERVSVIENRIKEISKELNIESILDKYPGEVSGGQKQRGAVCRAIATKPSLVLADEPTGALDSKSARDLLNCLLKLNKDSNKTILMVTHDAISASFCNRILFIKDGIIFTEIVKGESNREFYNKIVNTVSLIGGVNKNDFI